ncbi:MAG: hypothetical protein H0V88_14760, partial [Pyrinomonadaceae bacterium]|nr:hypothetical protein [Pyrinomonadaceae bacterium]
PAPSTLQFRLGSVSTNEGAGKVVVSVQRTGSLTQAATVNYETVSGTASERSDFTTTIGTLSFAAGEEEKIIEVLLTDDTLQEAAETFTLRLTNAAGATIGSTSTTTVTLTDNDDAASSRTNMIDTLDGFVRQQYVDFLNREPDAAGFQFWKSTLQGYLNACGTADNAEAITCRARAKASVSEAFFVSVEFQQTGYLVYRLYKTSFDPAARPRGLPRYVEFLRDAQQLGSGVVVNSPGWEAKLNGNTETFVRELVQRSEFVARYPTSMTAEQYVAALLTNAGLPLTGAEQQAALAAYSTGGVEGRARALRSIAESDLLFRKEFNKAFVLMQYFGYLRRNADEGEDAPAERQFKGYDFWLTKLNTESGDTARFTTLDQLLAPTKRAQMVEAFVVTGEYRRRFGTE